MMLTPVSYIHLTPSKGVIAPTRIVRTLLMV